MKKEYRAAKARGEVIKYNVFETPHGKYAIFLTFYNNAIYFFKYKDGELVEVVNLSELSHGTGSERG